MNLVQMASDLLVMQVLSDIISKHCKHLPEGLIQKQDPEDALISRTW